jgi:hypothetical protein
MTILVGPQAKSCQKHFSPVLSFCFGWLGQKIGNSQIGVSGKFHPKAVTTLQNLTLT